MGGLYLLPRDPAGHGFWDAVGFELIGIKRAKESDFIEWSLNIPTPKGGTCLNVSYIFCKFGLKKCKLHLLNKCKLHLDRSPRFCRDRGWGCLNHIGARARRDEPRPYFGL